MKWDVRGAMKADGRSAQLVVEAPNQRAGELVANQRGMVVESCWPVQDGVAVTDGTPKRGGGGGGWRFLRNLSLLLAIVGGGALAAMLAFDKNANDTLLLAAGGAGAVGVLGFLLFAVLGRRGRGG